MRARRAKSNEERLEELIAEANRRFLVRGFEVPRRFVDFCAWIGVTLTDAQRVFCRVAYDGDQPGALSGNERELAMVMFDGVIEVPIEARDVVWTLAGGRAGKSYVLGALRLVHGAYVRDLSSLAPGQRAVALSVAPKDSLRQEVINYQLGAVRSRPELAATIVSPRYLRDDATCESFVIKRPDGYLVTFEGGTANRGGYGGRGRSLTDFLADEAAFFQDANHIVNDKEIFKAASPRVLPGGQTIGQSTAYAKLGHHYEQWKKNFGAPQTGLAARATTEMLRPAAAKMVARERAVDPENARREFDAEPMGDAPLTFFSAALIDQCFDSSLVFPRTPSAPDSWNPETKAAGADFGFRSNTSACAIIHRAGDEIFLADLLERRPTEDMPLKPSETTRVFADRCADHGVTYVMADGHYREAIVENLGDIGFLDSPGSPSDACVRARTLMRNGRVRIPNPASVREESRDLFRRFVQQLKEVKGAPVAGGGYTIKMPLWADGSHGDIAAAFILALYQMGGEEEEAPPPAYGSREWQAEEKERMREQLREQLSAGRRR
jgi:hypothetical protein